MTVHQRIQLICAALFGFCSVGLAAAGSHMFFEKLNATGLLSSFEKAVDYALYSAMLLIAVVILQAIFSGCRFVLVGYAWIVGTFLFSGGLLLHSLAQLHQFIYIVPVGGVILIFGWFLLGVLALFAKPRYSY